MSYSDSKPQNKTLPFEGAPNPQYLLNLLNQISQQVGFYKSNTLIRFDIDESEFEDKGEIAKLVLTMWHLSDEGAFDIQNRGDERLDGFNYEFYLQIDHEAFERLKRKFQSPESSKDDAIKADYLELYSSGVAILYLQGRRCEAKFRTSSNLYKLLHLLSQRPKHFFSYEEANKSLNKAKGESEFSPVDKRVMDTAGNIAKAFGVDKIDIFETENGIRIRCEVHFK